MIKETYYMSQIDNRLYYIKDGRVAKNPKSYTAIHLFPDMRTEEVRNLIELQDMVSIKGLKMDERLYFISETDSMVHNLSDWEHKKLSDSEAYIGRDLYEFGFRVEETVKLWTLKEIKKYLRHANRIKKG